MTYLLVGFFLLGASGSTIANNTNDFVLFGKVIFTLGSCCTWDRSIIEPMVASPVLLAEQIFKLNICKHCVGKLVHGSKLRSWVMFSFSRNSLTGQWKIVGHLCVWKDVTNDIRRHKYRYRINISMILLFLYDKMSADDYKISIYVQMYVVFDCRFYLQVYQITSGSAMHVFMNFWLLILISYF